MTCHESDANPSADQEAAVMVVATGLVVAAAVSRRRRSHRTHHPPCRSAPQCTTTRSAMAQLAQHQRTYRMQSRPWRHNQRSNDTTHCTGDTRSTPCTCSSHNYVHPGTSLDTPHGTDRYGPLEYTTLLPRPSSSCTPCTCSIGNDAGCHRTTVGMFQNWHRQCR